MPASRADNPNGQAKPDPPAATSGWSIFSVPRPIKRVFDAFPLHAYPANDRPVERQQLRRGDGHALFLWTTLEDADWARASFNPTCLKWQVCFPEA
jgi:metaxin